MTVRTKFKVHYVSKNHNNSMSINLSAVTDGSEENKTFWSKTPAGTIGLVITNPDAANQFVEGQEYYVDFVLAESV